MEPRALERRMIDAAAAIASTIGDDSNHTVSAAALDTAGRIHTGVNVHHFTGGPCAELVVLGVAAAAHAGPLVAMVASADGGRGILPPCGRCRQVMMDLHPDIVIAVPTGAGTTMRSLRDLLPDSYLAPEAAAARMLRFDAQYRAAIVSGEKTSTVRWGEHPAVGPALFHFEGDDALEPIAGRITAITRVARDDLTPKLLQVGPDGSVEEFVSGLRERYPTMPTDASVDIVEFEVERERARQ